MRSSIILTVPFAAMALGQVVRSPLHHMDFPIHLSSFARAKQKISVTWTQKAKSSLKGRVLLTVWVCPFSPTPSASSPASRQSSPLSLCQWPLRQHLSLCPSLPNQQLSPSLPLFQLASIQPWFKSHLRPSPLPSWWFRRQSQTPPSLLEPSGQQRPVQVPSQGLLEQQAQHLELLGALPAQAQHPLPAPLLVWCNPFSASAWLAQSLPPSSKQDTTLGFGSASERGGQ